MMKRPPPPIEKSDRELDLKALAEELETRLLMDFDLDENGGLSMKEFIIALEAIRPGPPPGGLPGLPPGKE